MTSSDERREVARKIREYVDAYGDKIEDAEMVLLGTVWCRGEFGEVVRPTSEAELLAMVADLIDPKCKNKADELNRMAPREMLTDNLICSACGETFCADPDGVNFPIDWAYCPNCGARVVRGGED